ncbi:MAG: isoprenylcysteine carboxylmethyltransferase family protein [Anaerolineales bacterium]|nr:isoprenylcysteine carboxylmethyltransferase family protein [Anaerolineales bacterium]
MLWRIIVFAIVTAWLASISRTALRDPDAHGFFRFFAWEAILALFLLNIDYWLLNPLAWYQIIAWVLLTACIVPVVWGTILLKQTGKPGELREGDPNLLAFEKTTRLVTTGIFQYIRHPLYSSLLLLAWGIFFKQPGIWGAILVTAATLFLVLTARADEAECIRFFGPQYEEYMLTTRRFLPFLF